jgi:hypothetical protein
MGTETLAPEWRATPLDSWERYRRDWDGDRRVIVARGTYGGWVWDLWGTLEAPACPDLGDAATASQAMDDADRAVAEYATLTDYELIARNGIDAFAGVVTLKVVNVGQGTRCVMCRNEIDPSPAAEETGEERWLWCGSCACRNPGSSLPTGWPQLPEQASPGQGSEGTASPDDPAADLPPGMTTLRSWAARQGRSHDRVRHWRTDPDFPGHAGELPPRGRHGGGLGEQYFNEAALDEWLARRPDLAPPERIDPSAARIDLGERIALGKFAGLIGKARGTVNQHRDRPGFPPPGEDGLYGAGDLLEYWNTRPGRRGKARKDP